MSKDYNRHKEQVYFRKAKRIANLFCSHNNDETVKTRLAYRYKRNRKPCSCSMCCNVRRSKHVSGKNKLTLQERRHSL